MPHGINVDSNDNIWVTDVGLHQVIKYTNNKYDAPSAILGEKNIPGKDHSHFCQPSDIAIQLNGDFFVADGYCNSRVIKFNSKGNFLTEWGSEEHGKPGHFFVPHAIALQEANNLICVADRENRRVQCFDLLGNFMFQSSNDNEFGPIYGVAFATQNSSVLFALNGFNIVQDRQHERRVFLIETKHGAIVDQIDLNQSLVTTPHNIKVSSDSNDIYISHLNPPEVLKYSLVNNNCKLIDMKIFFVVNT
jgi:DNA-binding beta-propeller fold protein YncE